RGAEGGGGVGGGRAAAAGRLARVKSHSWDEAHVQRADDPALAAVSGRTNGTIAGEHRGRDDSSARPHVQRASDIGDVAFRRIGARRGGWEKIHDDKERLPIVGTRSHNGRAPTGSPRTMMAMVVRWWQPPEPLIEIMLADERIGNPVSVGLIIILLLVIPAKAGIHLAAPRWRHDG